MQSVTVIAPNATFADGLSTAIFVLGREKGIKLTEAIEEIGVIIVSEDEDGNRQITISTNVNEKVTLE